jgi:mono/diheme cytochrome c family protein
MSAPDPKAHNPRIEQAGASDEKIQKVHSILLREKPEPAEGYSPMPLFLLGFVSAMIFIGSIYFVHNRAGFDSLAYDERYDPEKAGGAGTKAAVDPVAAGKKLFTTCASCHQPGGTGVPGVYPPLVKSEWVIGSEERVIRILLHGLNGEISVEGQKYNGVMPNFGQGVGGYNWTDEKVAYVLTYIRQEWGNSGAPVTAEKVAEIRAKEGARKTAWTQAELEAIK